MDGNNKIQRWEEGCLKFCLTQEYKLSQFVAADALIMGKNVSDVGNVGFIIKDYGRKVGVHRISTLSEIVMNVILTYVQRKEDKNQ